MNPSVSTIQHIKDCPLKYRLHFIIGLRKLEDESAEHHLRFGAAMHKAMEVIYKAQVEHNQCCAAPSVYRMKAEVIKQAKNAFLTAYPRQLDLNDNAKTQESGVYAIESYLRRYAREDAHRWRILAVESPEMYDSGFITHLDMVAENMEHGGIYGFDFKHTKKALNYEFWRKFEPSSQIARYVDFIKSKYGSCEGFYIRATQFGYRSQAYKGEPAGFYVKHEAQLFNVNEQQIEMERASSRYWERIIKQATADDALGVPFAFGMNTDHCQWCQYRPICMAGWQWPEDQELITNQYRVVCNQLTPNLRACALDVGHDGNHSEERPRSEDEMVIEVEL